MISPYTRLAIIEFERMLRAERNKERHEIELKKWLQLMPKKDETYYVTETEKMREKLEEAME